MGFHVSIGCNHGSFAAKHCFKYVLIVLSCFVPSHLAKAKLTLQETELNPERAS